jgi:hypothetical protein
MEKKIKTKNKLLLKNKKIIPAPKHPFYSLGEIRGSLP